MNFKLSFIFAFALIVLSACGQGSSTSNDGRGKQQSNFVGSQTIVLNSAGNTASEVDDFVLKLEGDIVTIIDEDFRATGTLGPANQFSLSSPTFSTSSEGITCTGNVDYSGTISGENVSGSISGSFNCSGTNFDLSGDFSGAR